MDLFREIYENWMSRLHSRVLGAIIFSFVVINWQQIYFLFMSNEPAIMRLRFFNISVDWHRGIVFPILGGLFYVIFIPWVNFFLDWAIQLPRRMYRIMVEKEELNQSIRKIDHEFSLQAARSRFQAARDEINIQEAETLNRAKEVGGEELKEKIEKDREASASSTANQKQNAEDLVLTLNPFQKAVILALGRSREGASADLLSESQIIIRQLNEEGKEATKARRLVQVNETSNYLEDIAILTKTYSGHMTLTGSGYDIYDILLKS